MTITFENGSTGVFDVLNEIFTLQSNFDQDADDLRSSFNTLVSGHSGQYTDSQYSTAFSNAESALTAFEDSIHPFVTTLQQIAERVVIEAVDADTALPSKSIETALAELFRQMDENSVSLDDPSVGSTVTPDGSNTGDAVMVVSTKLADGTTNPYVLAESIVATAALVAGASNVRVTASSDAARIPLSPDGIGGSGLSGAILNPIPLTVGITGSGNLDAFTTNTATLPGTWVVDTGTLDTDITAGQPETGDITITGSPTSGTYRITLTTSSLGTQSTISLAYNASQSTVQSAIRALTGFSNVVVSTTGTTPNFVHTLKYFGLRESVTASVVNNTNSGLFAIATPIVTIAPSLGSTPIIMESDGSTLLSISRQLTHLVANGIYAVNAWLAVNTAAASGVVTISLTNGVGGSVLTDDDGNNLSYTVNATSLTTSMKASASLTSGDPFFCLPSSLPASVYLRIQCSTTLPNTRKLYVNNPTVAAVSRFYTGGPLFALYVGPTGIKAGDFWTVAFTNDYSGTTSWMMERNFGLRNRGLIPPHSSSGTITDFTPAT